MCNNWPNNRPETPRFRLRLCPSNKRKPETISGRLSNKRPDPKRASVPNSIAHWGNRGRFLKSSGEKACQSVEESCFLFWNDNSRPKTTFWVYWPIHISGDSPEISGGPPLAFGLWFGPAPRPVSRTPISSLAHDYPKIAHSAIREEGGPTAVAGRSYVENAIPDVRSCCCYCILWNSCRCTYVST